MTNTTELLPCPFCGGDPILNHIEPHSHALRFIGEPIMPDYPGSWTIECCDVGMIKDTREEVVAAWNRRASAVPEWVNVNEKLPEPFKPVLAQLKPKRKNMKPRFVWAMYCIPKKGMHDDDEPGWFDEATSDSIDPTHWTHIAAAAPQEKEGVMVGPCAKATVTCTIVATDGQRFVGQNVCANPQAACPRLPGEDYTKCRTVCQQLGHAEVVASRLAGKNAIGGTAYLEGHTYACDPCKAALEAVGITNIVIGRPE